MQNWMASFLLNGNCLDMICYYIVVLLYTDSTVRLIRVWSCQNIIYRPTVDLHLIKPTLTTALCLPPVVDYSKQVKCLMQIFEKMQWHGFIYFLCLFYVGHGSSMVLNVSVCSATTMSLKNLYQQCKLSWRTEHDCFIFIGCKWGFLCEPACFSPELKQLFCFQPGDWMLPSLVQEKLMKSVIVSISYTFCSEHWSM